MTTQDRIGPATLLLWLAIFAGLPALVASHVAGDEASRQSQPPAARPHAAQAERPPTPPPPLPPQELYALDNEAARRLNAAIPFSSRPNPAARPFIFAGSPEDLARATDCLAAAQIYEAGDDAVGERAVAQVVLNRVRHPAFPKTVCGVVFQGQERRTGCQFTFTCDGALARTPSPGAWDRAREIARGALAGMVFKPVGYATHYHTDWVVPYWSGSLDKIDSVGTHLFFRWRGWWGTPPAFRRSGDGAEPLIAKIARLSSAHQAAFAERVSAPSPASPAAALAALPQRAIDAGSVGRTVGGARLIAIAPGAKTFLVELGRAAAPDSWPSLAQTFCAGRPECRIMAWRAGAAPAALPLTDAQLGNMSFAYIHNIGSGLQRALWNCGQTPRTGKGECMRRVPTAGSAQVAVPPAAVPTLGGVRRKERFETVKIAPVAPPTLPTAR
ncbi:MAG: cell wall hydrolase [Sphingobium sp.]